MAARRSAAFLVRALATLLALLASFDAAFVALFPRLPRLTDNFSANYLAREVRSLRREAPVVVVGDSVLWGYRIAAGQTAVARIAHERRRWVNLSYEGGSPANSYAMLRILERGGVRPAAVVFNVNLKEFNAEDSAYAKLDPAVERLAWGLLEPAERAILTPVVPQTLDARMNRAVESIWQLYGMRSDLREALFNDADAATAAQGLFERADGTASRKAFAARPTAEKYEGTYDLSPLDGTNVSVFFLRRFARALREERIPAYALLTPANHHLLHDYIDVPEYQRQLAYVRALLLAQGVHVIDGDRAIPPAEFIDNDHLTPAGNRRLAALLLHHVPE